MSFAFYCAMSYSVYILSNERHTVFYTGITNNLERRTLEHKLRLNSGFTKKYNCDQLVYFEEFTSIEQAIDREKELKKFRREWKLQLIRSFNPEFIDLSMNWYDSMDL